MTSPRPLSLKGEGKRIGMTSFYSNPFQHINYRKQCDNEKMSSVMTSPLPLSLKGEGRESG